MKYFKLKEFDSPDEPGSGKHMNKEIVHMLDAVRKKFGKPIKINSGYRTVDRFKLLNLLLEVGFNRIGIAKSFIHVDIDKNKSQNVIWGY